MSKKKKNLKKKKKATGTRWVGWGRKVCLDVTMTKASVPSPETDSSVRTLGLWLTQHHYSERRGSYCTDDAVRIGFPPGEKVKLDPYLTPHTHTYKQIPGLKT